MALCRNAVRISFFPSSSSALLESSVSSTLSSTHRILSKGDNRPRMKSELDFGYSLSELIYKSKLCIPQNHRFSVKN